MWKLTENRMTDENGNIYTAYGFICGDVHVTDFSSLKEDAQNFLDLLNRMEVSPIHIYDVIEDYFAQV